ncbi:hypothetical protein C8R44DRAFT_856648 [Mycena epipterygia]|nr:hypothetical protein C8R44DRAFT_856648 [Mycena epipterygia]
MILLLLASRLLAVDAVSSAANFNTHTLLPPASSSGRLVFNWHDSDDSGDHNAVDTDIFLLTDGGNSILADSICGYVIEAMAAQFNKTHFNQSASSTPWIAIFSCTTNSSAGNASDLISNAQKLGAHAILVYTEEATYSFCNLTDNTPPVTIPIYITENWHVGATVFSDELAGLFAPSKIKFYNATAMNNLAANLTSDFSALRTNGLALTQSDAILARIPVISTNVSVVASTASPTTLAPAATKTPSSAMRTNARFSVAVLLLASVFWGWR